MTTFQKYLIDPFERAGSTFAQQFALFLLAAGGSLLVSQNFLAAADSAVFAAIIALITSYVLILTGLKVTGWFDVGRRVLLTFGQSLGGTLAADNVTHSVVHAGWTGALAIAVNVAGVAFLKSLVGLSLPHTIGGSVVSGTFAQGISTADLDYDTSATTITSTDDFVPRGRTASQSGPDGTNHDTTDYSALADGAVGGADASQISQPVPTQIATLPVGIDYAYQELATPDHVAEHAAPDAPQA